MAGPTGNPPAQPVTIRGASIPTKAGRVNVVRRSTRRKGRK